MDYTPTIISKQYACKTIQEAVEVKSESFGAMIRANKELGLEKAKERVCDIIGLYIADLNESLNLKRQMSPKDMDECADLILSEYPYLQIHHIAYIFRQAKLGNYGEFYESINIPKVMSWFADFANEFQLMAAERHLGEHNQSKFQEMRPDTIGLAPRFAEVLKTVVKQPEKDVIAQEVYDQRELYLADPKITAFKYQLQEMEKAKVPVEELDAMQQNFLLYIKTTYPRLA